MATIITRQNPKTGKIERPHRDKQGNFVLGDPRMGKTLHHKANAVLTDDYDEVVCLVRKGYSIRMSAGDGSPASLISAGKLTLEDVDALPEGAVPSREAQAPFPRAKVMRDLQKALIAEASMIACWGSEAAAEAFIGFPSSDDAGEPYDNAEPDDVDLSRFRATPIIEAAYDYAFQTGRPEVFGPEYWTELESLIDGATAGTVSTPSPMSNPDSTLRVTLGTAFARWRFEFERHQSLSVRELAYLAQMTEVAARAALAKDGIKGRGGIDNKTARQWLGQRQKFVPTREALLPIAR